SSVHSKSAEYFVGVVPVPGAVHVTQTPVGLSVAPGGHESASFTCVQAPIVGASTPDGPTPPFAACPIAGRATITTKARRNASLVCRSSFIFLLSLFTHLQIHFEHQSSLVRSGG